ncbi:FimV/HubP family polar landmark protein [uncultured Amphritea sp.]|uniref:FimV/HubP family polar landmark protein n=1 Tax=uncultured Amphritea sp. TaxID=981605 RepID=UPI002637034B|nr:FimV/HubP family polar landmark protein [uncultured Amphritea sp.]
MLRKLALSLAIAGVLGTSNANALGLGEIRITSALNEPLQAEIQLLQMRSVDPQQILPRMANVDEFALAGIEKLRFLSDVKFEVKPGASGRGIIILTSSAPVKEPFLNFLVEVNWPSGRLVREYTVLLDPPIYDPTPAPVAVQPARSSAASAPASVAVKPMAPQAPVDNIRTRMTDGQVYVDVNDTLWDIAKRHKPSNTVSEAQMMLALQRKNPDAFRNNNVNQLKAGVVMSLPSLEEVQALNQKQANEEFWRQTQMWKQGVTPAAQPQQMDNSGGAEGADKAAATGKKGEEVAAKSAQGQLKIVSPDAKTDTSAVSDQAAGADMSQADSALLEKNKQLETDLASALESVDQIQRENAELTGRVDALAQQMETLQRMLELKDQQLADLQAELETAKKQPIASQVAAAPEPQAQPKSLLEEFGLYIGAAGGAIIAFLLALLFMRRGKKEDSSEAVVPGQTIDVDQPQDKDATVIPAVAAAAAVAAATESDESLAEETDLDELDLDLDMDLDKVEAAESQDIDEQEFDLGFDEDFGQTPVAAASMEDEDEVDDALDSILGEGAAESFDLDDLTAQSDLGDLGDLGPLPEVPEEPEEPEADSIEDLLAGGDVEEEAVDDDTDLEFDIQPMADVSEDAEPANELEDDLDLDFSLDVADAELENVELEDAESADFDEGDSLDLVMDDSVADEDDDFADLDSLLGEEESASDADDESADAELDALLAGVGDADVEELNAADSDTDLDLDLDDDLDADLQALLDGADDEVVLDEEEFAAPQADDESPLGHDLDAELDSELEMLLSDAGSDELSLDMTDDSEDDSLDGLNLLEGADEVETKLDLARAYIDMEDLDGAKDILEEIVKEGSEAQRSEANSLLNTIS